MATGEDVLRQSLELLNYTDRYIADPEDGRWTALRQRGLAAVNQIYSDLWYMERPGVLFLPLDRLEDTLRLSVRSQLDILPFGVAMLLAQSEGDGDQQQLYAALYNQKRGAAVKPPMRRRDVLFQEGCACDS